MKGLINTCLILVIVLVSLSAYLRLTHSGIGCVDWPHCYGRIGDFITPDAGDDSQSPYQEIVSESNQPLAWATPLHRFVASALGLLILMLNLVAIRRKRSRLLCLCLLGLTVYLAILGIRSGSLYEPAVIMGNLSGGFLMLGMLGWLAITFNSEGNGPVKNRPLMLWSCLALVIVSLQIIVGGLTSANFAATACTTLPDCHGSWLPDGQLTKALDLSRQHQVGDSGIVIGGGERPAIHQLHRLGAVLSLLILVIVGIKAIRGEKKFRIAGTLVILLAALEFAVGVLAVVSALPIALAVSHNWLAGLMVLALLWLISLARYPVSGDDRQSLKPETFKLQQDQAP